MSDRLKIRVEGVPAKELANLARFAHYIGVVAQINGSLIDSVTVDNSAMGPESVTADGTHMTLGPRHLPSMVSGTPASVAAWCGAALHGMGHSRYSPRVDEPLRHQLMQRDGFHRTWNMIEDARIERLLLRDFPGWRPHLMGAVAHILLRPPRYGERADMGGVYPLLVGRTYLPAELRAEAYDAFAAEHSNYIADAVHDLVFQYMGLLDPGTEDCDETIEIVKRLKSLLGNYGTECGSCAVDDDQPREWADPGDPSDDDDEADGDDGGEPDPDGDESDGDEPGDDGDEPGGEGDVSDDGDEADGGDGDGQADTDGGDSDGDADDGDGSDDDDGSDSSSKAGSESASRLVDWVKAINTALAQDERLNDISQAVLSGPMPTIELRQRVCKLHQVPEAAVLAESEIARELRVLMDGARPGMRRRVDRGRFNLTRLIREGGTTRVDEMFDRHDPGALRSTGCAVSMLADVSGSMGTVGISGAMQSVWAVERAVLSVRGAFKAWTFGSWSHELPASMHDKMQFPVTMDGATNPLAGLTSASAWLTQQREPNRLCIIATDGAWESHEQSVDVIFSMLASGVMVAVFGIDIDEELLAQRFGSIHVCRIDEASDLGPAVGEMLVNRIRSGMAR